MADSKSSQIGYNRGRVAKGECPIELQAICRDRYLGESVHDFISATITEGEHRIFAGRLVNSAQNLSYPFRTSSRC